MERVVSLMGSGNHDNEPSSVGSVGVTQAESPRAKFETDPTYVQDLDSAAELRDSAEAQAFKRSAPALQARQQETEARELHSEEVARARSWSGVLILLCIASLFFVPLLGGTWNTRMLVIASLVVLMAVSIWVWDKSAEEANYTSAVFRTFGYTAACVSFVLEYYLGVFSPTPLVVTLGITFFGLGRDRWHALAICMFAIVGYLILALLTIAGIVPDSPVMPANDAPLMARLYFAVIGPMVMLVSLWMAQVSRKSMDTALKRAMAAMRLVQQREAQLFEAQQQLEMALQVGDGVWGRYTGMRAGRYDLGDLVGRGGMGEVYAAEQGATRKIAAVKVLSPDFIGDDTQHERFVREGQIAGSLSSDHIVTVYDVGFIEGRVPYIAMELLHGTELAAYLRREPTMSAPRVVDMIHQLARGLDQAHAAGIIHRDLKPQNIFCCDPSGVWKILDFGVSKLRNAQMTLTAHGKVVGTPGYMAPEQAMAKDVDARTDVFALGSVAYRCLTGRPAYVGADIPSVLYKIVHEDPTPPSELVADLTVEVDDVIATALAKHPDDRYESAGAFARALRDAASASLRLR